MRILLTGADSDLGALVIERLCARDQILAHRREEAGSVSVPCEWGDVGDESFIRALAKGCQALIHLMPEALGPKLDQAVARTTTLIEAARWAGVRRVVVLSCAMTITGTSDPWAVADESHQPSDETLDPTHARARAAENAALARHDNGFTVLSLNPAPMLGPVDVRGDGARLLRWASEEAPPLHGGMAFTDARDVVAAVETALARGHGERRHLLMSRNITWRRLAGRLRRAMALPCEHAIGPARASHFIDDTAARQHLGWWTRSPEHTLTDTLSQLAFTA